MNYMLVVINGLAIILIGFIVWWFFIAKPAVASQSQDAPVAVLIKNGVYQPSYIQVHADKPIKLRFVREDASPCSATVIFPQLNMSYQLPLNQTTDILLPPQPAGEVDFTCQMGMYRGKLVIV